MATAAEFRQALINALLETELKGREFLEITAGELHRTVGEYPGKNHRLPMCCRVMRVYFCEGWGDRLVNDPAGGQGATLRIRYRLPRPQDGIDVLDEITK
jgi:hypothetical protein